MSTEPTTVTEAEIAEMQALRGQGMTSAVGEYTPPELWLLLDEVVRLRAFAGTCYAGLVAACDLPEAWADAFLAASRGDAFAADGLIPFTQAADPSQLSRAHAEKAAQKINDWFAKQPKDANSPKLEAVAAPWPGGAASHAAGVESFITEYLLPQGAVAGHLLVEALQTAEAALADIGDADREDGDDLEWAEGRAAQALPVVRHALGQTRHLRRPAMDVGRALQVLIEHNTWRRGGEGPQTDPTLLGQALDTAIAALQSPKAEAFQDGMLLIQQSDARALVEAAAKGSESSASLAVLRVRDLLSRAAPATGVGS